MSEFIACFPCANGLYEECLNLIPIEGDPEHFKPCMNVGLSKSDRRAQEAHGIGRPLKDVDEIMDPRATGSKRAATMYPLHFDEDCEWTGLLYAGGGYVTVVGCRGNLQEIRHHGPVVDMLENGPGNVHRICNQCDQRWHTLNASLEPGVDVLEHDRSTRAGASELDENELWWASQQLAAPRRGDH